MYYKIRECMKDFAIDLLMLTVIVAGLTLAAMTIIQAWTGTEPTEVIGNAIYSWIG